MGTPARASSASSQATIDEAPRVGATKASLGLSSRQDRPRSSGRRARPHRRRGTTAARRRGASWRSSARARRDRGPRSSRRKGCRAPDRRARPRARARSSRSRRRPPGRALARRRRGGAWPARGSPRRRRRWPGAPAPRRSPTRWEGRGRGDPRGAARRGAAARGRAPRRGSRGGAAARGPRGGGDASRGRALSAKLFGAAEAAEARRALDHAGALAAPREEQGGVEAGYPAPDDQRLRGCRERREARHGPPLCRHVENVSQYQFDFDVSVDFIDSCMASICHRNLRLFPPPVPAQPRSCLHCPPYPLLVFCVDRGLAPRFAGMSVAFLLAEIRALMLDLARLDPRAGMPVLPPRARRPRPSSPWSARSGASCRRPTASSSRSTTASLSSTWARACSRRRRSCAARSSTSRG